METTIQNFSREIRNNRRKCNSLIAFLLFQTAALFSQQLVYDNFEGDKQLHYGEHNGVLDSLSKNPKVDGVNNSAKCGLYIRNAGKKFDNIKMYLPTNLSAVIDYATYLGTPPKLKMKIYTNAPIGTLVEILLGNRNGNNAYPAGTNSQYQVYTTKNNAWEELEFKFSQVPQGSETSFNQVDQITLLFNPNSSTSNAYYFDDITGPSLSLEKPQDLASPKKSGIANEGKQKSGFVNTNTDKKGNTNKRTNKN